MTSSLSSRNKANKRRGAQYENDLITHLRGKGLDAERLRLTGSEDEGDIVVRGNGNDYIFEAKNTKQHNLAEFVSESETEADNYANHRGKEVSTVVPVVVMKRRNQSINKSYVVMSLDTLLRLINV